MYSFNRKFIVLYNVDLLASSWNPHFRETVCYTQNHSALGSVYTVLARHINKTYYRGNISKYTELLLVTANEQFIRLCS